MPTRLQPLRSLWEPADDFRRAGNRRLALGMLAMLAIFFSSAAAQNQIELKRAQEFYAKALPEKKAATRVELRQQAAQCCEAGDPTTLPPAARRQIAAINFALGREYFQQAKWPAAIAHLEKAVAADPAFAAAHATLGLIYFQQRRYEEAIAAYNRVLPAQPSAQLYNNLGAAHEAKGDLDAAIAAYRRALELDAKLVQAQKNLQRAQEKSALRQPAPAIETKIAAGDSVTPRRDSLAAVAPKSAPRAAKNKTAKNPKPDRGQTPEIKTAVSVEKNKNEPVAKKGTPTREIEAAPSSPPLALALKKSSPAPRRPAEIDAARKIAEKTFSPSNAVVVAKNSSGPSAFAYICGVGAVLFGVFIFTQRRRLNRMWLQLTPTPAKPVRDERLIPANAMHPAAAVADEETVTRLLMKKPAVGATAESALMTEDDDGESRQPSLQTQAFFAEMIAAEPESEAFADELPEAGADLKPTNGHVEASYQLPVISNQSSVVSDQSSVVSDQSSVVSYQQQETSHQLPVTSNQQPVISHQQQETGYQSPVTSHQQQETGNQLPVTSHQQQETGNQLPVTSHQQQETSNQSPATSCRQQETGYQLSALGRYQIEREIGKGAMGKIYLALDPKLDRRVVIKTVCFNLAASDADTTTIKDRVYREARAIAKLSHPNIVVVYDVEDDRDLSYIVMEHIEGRDLRQALKEERRFEHERALKIIAQVCNALDYAHQAGIIHRDIKPSNIMLLPNDKAKVTDFGIAKIADHFSLTLPGHVLGTPSYMAPEQFEGETADSRADIFSLGTVLYELLTGVRPFAGDSLAALAYKIVHKMHIPPSLQNVELPLELDEIIAKALAKNPDERYQTALEFREALSAAKFAIAA